MLANIHVYIKTAVTIVFLLSDISQLLDVSFLSPVSLYITVAGYHAMFCIIFLLFLLNMYNVIHTLSLMEFPTLMSGPVHFHFKGCQVVFFIFIHNFRTFC